MTYVAVPAVEVLKISFSIISSWNILVVHTGLSNELFLYLTDADEDIRHRAKFSKISSSLISSCNILVVNTEFSNKLFLHFVNLDENIRHTSPRLR